MRSLWNEAEAARHTDDLSLRVYSSRLLGGDPSLVLHGGGNTSVKSTVRTLFGEDERVLFVKGSGWDLGTIEAAGFAPVRLAPLLRLATLDALSDTQMVNELRGAMTDAAAPTPSVEAILHAVLPFPWVDHTHADALLALMNTPVGEERVREVYGDSVVLIPYVMPGFALARAVAELFPAQSHAGTVGMVLYRHGLFTWGDTAREAYERHIELVSRAEEYLAGRGAWAPRRPTADHRPPAADDEGGAGAGGEAPTPRRVTLAALRHEISHTAGFPMIMSAHDDPQALGFARRPDVGRLATQGCVTPDHVIRTKRVPLIGRDVAEYAAAYRAYFEENAARGLAGAPLVMLDPAPRIVLDPELGLLALGRTARDAAVAEEIYRHTIDVVERAAALGGYEALPPGDLFDVEYWELEQAKLARQGRPPALAGEVALVTGAASGIGRACVTALRARGAAVAALDVSPAVSELAGREVLALERDVADPAAPEAALEECARAFGGLDMLVLNAGIFPRSAPIAALSDAEWERVLRVNLDANLALLRLAHPLLKLAPRGGRVAVIGSKNVPAPGPGAAAYSASKAALTQLARVAALEWGADGIRVNVLHPNAVFDTGLWT
jgi:rhamnose utilization protein RhaD (predicted bifunctional aldolase and dehydrogenase)/NAD(P)-dependent dehydrogenase (short-subunit alcohol dehydrogenase family)